MKTILMIVLMAICLVASAQLIAMCSGSENVQNVGGDFGRAWLSSNLAQNPGPAAQGSNNSSNNSSNNTSSDWGSVPKGKAEVNSDLVKGQNTPKTAANWLGDSMIIGDQTSPMNSSAKKVTQPQPFSISQTLSPIHKMDASFSQTSGSPQPDANGLINGWPADTYYAIGPALDFL